jgi:hypothetical protein
VSGVAKDPSKCRLRRTNMFEEVSSEALNIEAISIAKEGIINGQLVLLEDGVVLKKVCGRGRDVF